MLSPECGGGRTRRQPGGPGAGKRGPARRGGPDAGSAGAAFRVPGLPHFGGSRARTLAPIRSGQQVTNATYRVRFEMLRAALLIGLIVALGVAVRSSGVLEELGVVGSCDAVSAPAAARAEVTSWE